MVLPEKLTFLLPQPVVAFEGSPSSRLQQESLQLLRACVLQRSRTEAVLQPAETSPGGLLPEPEVRGKWFPWLWTGGGQPL